MLFKVYCENIVNTLENGKSDDLVVYYGVAESFVNKLHIFYEYLSDHEKSRADRFRLEPDYRCYVSLHALLRIELSKFSGIKLKSIRIGESDFGKPFLRDIDLPFSISRAKNVFAFVIGHSNQLLGIDIEQVKPNIDYINISRNYFSITEQQLILSCRNLNDQKCRFFEIWTRKEALLKAIGIGLSAELTKVQVLEGENILSLAGLQINNHVFKIATTIKKEAFISIASSVDFIPAFRNLSFILS